MYRWCSYCQTYQGEVPPHDNFSLTHGICSKCKKDRKISSDLPPVISFFNGLREQLQSGGTPQWKEIMDKAEELKIQPMDLLQGVIQPLMNEVGELYASGKITVFHEHLFTSRVKCVLSEVEHRMGISQFDTIDFLLTCVEGNYHDLGNQIISLWCNSKGIRTKALGPSLPADSVAVAVRTLKPKVLGISIYEKESLSDARALIDLVRKLPESPAIVVGGLAIKGCDTLKLGDYSYTGKTPNELIQFLESILESRAKAA